MERMLRWATQDQMPVDGVPFIGPVDPVSKNVYVATGFRKWGLAMGIAAGELLASLVDGVDHPWAGLFDTSRLRPRAGALVAGSRVARSFCAISARSASRSPASTTPSFSRPFRFT
jgi:hypothetical protein